MSGQGNDTTGGGGGTDTPQGASFALTVPGPGTPPSPTFVDLTRLGAVDASDEPLLNVDPSNTASSTFASATGSSSVPGAAPFGAGGLSYTTGTLQFVAPKSYLRLGGAGGYEAWLTSDPDNAASPSKPSDATAAPFGGTGIVLHSEEQITSFAPAINNKASAITNSVDDITTWSENAVSAVYANSEHTKIAVLSGTTMPISNFVCNANFQIADNLSSIVGNSISTIGGNAATIWTGADASTGLGSLLWSNFGYTQNVFAGQIVNMINGSVDMQGLKDSKYSDFDVLAPKKIDLCVAPVADAAKWSNRLATLSKAITLASMATVGGLTIAMEAVTANDADSAWNSQLPAEQALSAANAKLQSVLATYRTDMLALGALTVAVQVASIVAGLAILGVGKKASTLRASWITITSDSIELSAGGTKVTIGPDGFQVDAGDPDLIAEAAAAMTTLRFEDGLWEGFAANVMRMASNDPALSAMDEDELLEALDEDVSLDEVAPAVPVIRFNSLTAIQASAPQIQFNAGV